MTKRKTLKAKHIQALPGINGAGNDETWKAATALDFDAAGVPGRIVTGR